MNKPRPHYIETVKNIILVVLFFSTMLLLYFFWGSPVQGNFRISDFITGEYQEIPTFKEVIRPGRVVAHLVGGSYTVVDEADYNGWESYINTIKGLSKEDVLSVEEITEEQFDKIMEFRSITYRFHYTIPIEEFLKRYGIKDMVGAEQISEFSLMGFSSGSPESLFVVNEYKNKYYRIVSAKSHNMLEDLLSRVEAGGQTNYYSIGVVAGSTTKNTAVIPLSVESSLSQMRYACELEGANNNSLKEFAQAFFGESLDFVRQIQGSKGTHIYMYGYGEKVLTVSAKGRVEYKNKEMPQGNQQNLFEALDTAIQFVATHGGWQTPEGIELTPRVQSVKAVESNKQKGFTIIFEMGIGSETLYLKDSHSIMVEVIHGQVTQYLRDIIIVDENNLQRHTGGPGKETFSVINMIAQHYKYMAEVLDQNGEFSDLVGEELFDAVLGRIEYVKTGYMKPRTEDEKNHMLIPVWVVSTGDYLLYFDLYDAEPLGYAGTLGF